MTTFGPPLETALRSALEYLESLNSQPVAPAASLSELRTRLGKDLNEEPIADATVIEQLVQDTAGGIMRSAGGRFFAWAIGGSVPAALAADWLTSAWDQIATLYASGPAAAVAEEVAGGWLKDLLGIPQSASFALVTGCQMAHVTCLAAARHRLLHRLGWDSERDGLAGAPRIRILASNPHGTLGRAVRLLGFGEASMVSLPLDGTERTSPAVLQDHLRRAAAEPVILVLQAGDLNTGSFDDYEALLPIAREHPNVWVHIDGAFGLWAAASGSFRHLLRGAALADSWAADGHKWLNVPYDCGYAFVTDTRAHMAAMSQRSPYMVYASEARDEMDFTPEWSRRARGFATYAALRSLGRHGVEDLVDRCCRYARELVTGLAGLPGVEVLWHPIISQGMVRFIDPLASGDEAANDRFTDAVTADINSRGEAFFMGTTWRGKRAMRVSVLNWQTDADDVRRAIASVRQVLAERH